MICPFLFGFLFGLSTGAEILQHPKSRLVAAGVEVTFSCKINNSMDPQWVVNGEHTQSAYQMQRIRSQGFMLTIMFEGSVAVLSLRVNATENKNGTKLYCLSLPPMSSNTAVLLIIHEPPISPNPSIMNPNASSILFQWSPPFLWLGQAINYYDILITNNAGETLYYRVNTTFSDAVVSFTATVANYPDPILSCNDLHFSLSAVGSDQAKLPSFTATGGYIPVLANVSTNMAVNISVLYNVDMIPSLFIIIELSPVICNYQKLNYTIVIATRETAEHRNVSLGPYRHYGAGTITQSVSTALLKQDSEHSLFVVLNTITGSASSQEYTFDTHFQYPSVQSTQQPNNSKCDTSTYTIIMGISIGIATSMVLIIVFMIVCILLQRRGRVKVNETLVNVNPIYEGTALPLYEDVPPLTITASRITNSGDIDHTSARSCTAKSVDQCDSMCQRNNPKSACENPYMDQALSLSSGEYTMMNKAPNVVSSMNVQ